ncbi:MAG: amino acid ABC transporter ATP-binding protein [Candidatus Kariarchaeaceae archaeon]
MELLKIENLTKIYRPTDPPAIKDVNLTINKSEVVVIVGASGSGKSTLLRCLNRLIEPTSGTIIFKGVNILDSEVDVNTVREKIGMVFQSFNLFAHLRVIDNVTLGLKKVQKMDKEAAAKEAMEILTQVGLEDKADSYPGELSGGQAQRVGIARALAMKPELMLFDEPTSSLDPELVGGIIEIMENLAKHMTMIVVTHEMHFAKETATRVIYMDEGAIVEEGPPKQVLENPQNPRTREFLTRILEK